MWADLPTPPSRQLIGEIEPWQCPGCDALIYNLDEQGKPVPGAPMPHYWSSSLPRVCALCYDMLLAVSGSDYWKKLQDEWATEAARRKDVFERQTGKRDYFLGT